MVGVRTYRSGSTVAGEPLFPEHASLECRMDTSSDT